MRTESNHLYNQSKYNNCLFSEPSHLYSYDNNLDENSFIKKESRTNNNSLSIMIQLNSSAETKSEKYSILPYDETERPHFCSISQNLQRNDYFIDILDYCVESVNPLSFYFNCNYHKHTLCRITFLPIIQPKTVKIFANISICAETNSVCSTDDYFDSVSCIISQNKDGPRIIKRVSSGYVRFTKENHIFFKNIISNQSVNECFLKSAPASAPLILNDRNDNAESYTAYSAPYLCDDDSFEVLVTLIPSTKAAKPEPINYAKSITNREQEIVSLVARGFTNRYIAHKLIISEGTVKKTLHNAYKKLGIGSRMELIKLLHS